MFPLALWETKPFWATEHECKDDSSSDDGKNRQYVAHYQEPEQ